jgi:hypothetical protein
MFPFDSVPFGSDPAAAAITCMEFGTLLYLTLRIKPHGVSRNVLHRHAMHYNRNYLS